MTSHWVDHATGGVVPQIFYTPPGKDAGSDSPWQSDSPRSYLYEPISGDFPPFVPTVDNSDKTGPLPLMDASVPSNDYGDAGPI
ncbi:MAG: hypothetical protein JWN04_4141 [Myxococcaceae bacterium]|nr:hypothetical protein [Myxococcaceae bacterium]